MREVPLTAQTVLMENGTTPYRPRSLPQSFYETAGTGPTHSRLVALPDGPAFPDFAPEPLELRAPPPLKAPPYHLGPGDVVAIIRPAGVAELAGAGAQRDTFPVRDDGTTSILDAGRGAADRRFIDTRSGDCRGRTPDEPGSRAGYDPHLPQWGFVSDSVARLFGPTGVPSTGPLERGRRVCRY